jgi:RNA polymerase sigma-70 factor (ECF subfamily)
LIRRLGHREANALDLTQEYFARLLEKPVIGAARQARGRFRSFLRADCRNFLSDCRDLDQAQKRGGGRRPLPIDARDAEGRYLVEPADALTPDALYDRAWALALLDHALGRLAADYATTGRGLLFETLQGSLTGPTQPASYAEIARQLSMTEGAIQQAASRLRKRYREALRDEIAATLHEPSDAAVDSEIRDLFQALGRNK